MNPKSAINVPRLEDELGKLRSRLVSERRCYEKLGDENALLRMELESEKKIKIVFQERLEIVKNELEETKNKFLNAEKDFKNEKMALARDNETLRGKVVEIQKLTDNDKLCEANLYAQIPPVTNEAGVVFAFAILYRQLGFSEVLKVKSPYPDAIAVRDGRQVRIEFEYLSTNFRSHGHNVNGCDIVVCWKHDWVGCPIEVVEISKLFVN